MTCLNNHSVRVSENGSLPNHGLKTLVDIYISYSTNQEYRYTLELTN